MIDIVEVQVGGQTTTIEIITPGPKGQGVPVSGTAGQILRKTAIANFSTEWYSLVKADVALGLADNTSDVNKPVSTAQATAIAVVQADVDAHELRQDNPHLTTKAQVGLGSADNTTDIAKPVSTAQQTALNTKEPNIALGTVAQYWRGDKSWQDLFTDVRAATLTGLSTLTATTVVATHTVLQAIGFLQKQVGDNKGVADAHIARVDNPHAITKAQVGLGSADNTSDINKPVSTAQQTSLDAKATNTALAAHTSSVANPHTVTKAQVGLGSVDDTTDANKPVSTAQQTALNLKANAAGAVLTGTASAQTLHVSNVLGLPEWTTAGRPVPGAGKLVGYNLTLNQYEGYNGNQWGALGGGATGAPGNPVFHENSKAVTGSYTITAGKNAVSAGPVTINDGVIVTIPDGSTWTIV